MRIPLATLGFTTTIAQIVLIRELVATFYGNELLFGLILMVWLGWVAAGAWGLSRLKLFNRMSTRGYAMGLILSGVFLPAQMVVVRNARGLLNITPGAFVELEPTLLAVAFILAPLCLIGGLLFTSGARLLIAQGGSAGQAYVWESFGAIAGGMLFSFFLIHWLDPFQSALLVTAVNLVVALTLCLFTPTLVCLFPCPIPPLYTYILEMGTLFILLVLFLPIGHYLHQNTLRWQWPNLTYASDSPYGRIIIQAWNGQRAFFENGLLAFETQSTFPEEVVHIPLLAHPKPENILLIGGGVAGDIREILKYPVSQITYVELDPMLIKAAEDQLPPEDAVFLKDPRVSLILTDGRLFVRNTKQFFDVIILDLPEPATGSLNRFYTQDFFAEVRTILDTNGLFALGLPSAENYWSPELARRNASVYLTLKQIFPEIVVTPGDHNFFLASGQPIETDPSKLAQRLVERGVSTRWVTPDYLKYLFTTDRFSEVKLALETIKGVGINEDLRPICYYYDLVLWLSLLYPSIDTRGTTLLREVFERANPQNLWWGVLLLGGFIILARWRRNWAVPIAIACIGLVEMTMEVVILFAFSVLHGYVYAEVSLILTAFMTGLALGGMTSNHWLSKHQKNLGNKELNTKRILYANQIAIVLYCLSFPLFLRSPISTFALTFPLLAILAGFLTGMAFPLGVALSSSDTNRSIGILYGTDLLGGCMGAFCGAVFLIPIFGIPQTCIIIALVATLGFLVLVK